MLPRLLPVLIWAAFSGTANAQTVNHSSDVIVSETWAERQAAMPNRLLQPGRPSNETMDHSFHWTLNGDRFLSKNEESSIPVGQLRALPLADMPGKLNQPFETSRLTSNRWLLPVAGTLLGAGLGIWWGHRIMDGADDWVAVPPYIYTVPVGAVAGLIVGVLANGSPNDS